MKESDTMEDLTPITRLSRDLRTAAATLSDKQARYFVDAYYLIQNNRIGADGQVRSMAEDGEPVLLLLWVSEQMRVFENQIKAALDKYSAAHPVGQWARSVVGVGPVIGAGLLAHIDIRKAPTAGHIFSFAGLNPMVEWKKGEKRPWNADLKVLCWKLGESFIKVQGNDNDVYGHLYVQRKAEDWKANLAGGYANQAREILTKKKFDKKTQTYRFYSGQLSPKTIGKYVNAGQAVPEGLKATTIGDEIPMLPPAHVNARARRWAVKIFLSNLHEVWYEQEYGTPAPAPYPFAHLGHVHKIEPAKTIE